MIKVLLYRALRGFAASFVAATSVVTITNVGTWTDLGAALNSLALIGTIAGISGALLALEKALRWE